MATISLRGGTIYGHRWIAGSRLGCRTEGVLSCSCTRGVAQSAETASNTMSAGSTMPKQLQLLYLNLTFLHNTHAVKMHMCICPPKTTLNITWFFPLSSLKSCAWDTAMFYCTNFLCVIYTQDLWSGTSRMKSHNADLYSESRSLRKSRAIRHRHKRDDLSSGTSQEMVRGRWVPDANLRLWGVLISFGTQH